MSLDAELAAQAVAAASDAIITLDRSAKVTSWNLAAERPLGFSRDEAIEHGLVLIIPAEYRARHVSAFHAATDSAHLAHSAPWREWSAYRVGRPARARPEPRTACR